MTALSLTLRSPPSRRIDMSPVTPDNLLALRREDIPNIFVQHGNRRRKLKELFDIEGNNPATLVLRDTTSRLDAIGTNMRSGRILIEGDTGNYLGHAMRGGAIEVRGDAGDWAASGMAGGTLTVTGDCGNFAGGARPGDRRGMRGGTLLIHGDAGDRLGDHMRRGQILVRGNAGAYCGSRMIAGTIAMLGTAGAGAGFGMRRGTLLFSVLPDSLPATFADCGEHNLGFLSLLLPALRRLDDEFRYAGAGTRVRRFVGDMANGGNGELLAPV